MDRSIRVEPRALLSLSLRIIVAVAAYNGRLMPPGYMEGALKRIDAETSDYYILGYSVANPDTTRRTRQIDVQVRRPGIQVRSRSWYRTKGQPTSSPKR